MAETYQEKTEKPTEKKLEDARKKGQVAISREISTSFILVILTVFLYFTMSFAFSNMYRFYVHMLGISRIELDLFSIKGIISETFHFFSGMMIPVFGILLFVAVFSNLLQTGFAISLERLKFNLENINPFSGLRRIFTLRSLVEVLKACMKISFLIALTYSLFKKEVLKILSLTGSEPFEMMKYLGFSTFEIVLKIGVIFMLIAGLDYLYQRWQYLKDLMMTPQEVKEEFKEREGNPLVKSRIRAMMRALSKRRMMEDVKRSDVVITNPTHYAVALKYEMGKMPAPKVVAKGAGIVAENIKDVARAHMVPIVEDKIVAQALFFSVDVGDFIPEKFYVVVAEILAKVYRMRGRI